MLASLEHKQISTTLQAMRSGLQFEEAHLIASGSAQAVPGLVGSNPISFLMPIPHSYAGVRDPARDGSATCGQWFFDEAQAALGYQPCYAQRAMLAGDYPPLPKQIWVRVMQESGGMPGVRLVVGP